MASEAWSLEGAYNQFPQLKPGIFFYSIQGWRWIREVGVGGGGGGGGEGGGPCNTETSMDTLLTYIPSWCRSRYFVGTSITHTPAEIIERV